MSFFYFALLCVCFFISSIIQTFNNLETNTLLSVGVSLFFFFFCPQHLSNSPNRWWQGNDKDSTQLRLLPGDREKSDIVCSVCF